MSSDVRHVLADAAHAAGQALGRGHVMKSKMLPHILLAVVLALVAGVMTVNWLGSLRGKAEHRPKVEVKKVNVVVAAQPIAKGTRIAEPMLGVKSFELSLAPTSAEHAVADVTGRIAARDISKDDPITADKLLARGVSVAGLPALVEEGKRAMTVRGTKALGAGGLITPGSRVDVVATFQVPGKSDAKMSKLLMEDIPVLTTGTQMETRVGKDGKEELANTDLFTLMVTPAQAEALSLASDHGQLHFALRRSGDVGSVATSGADFQALAGTPPAAAGSGAGTPTSGTTSGKTTYDYQAVRTSAPMAVKKPGSGGGGAAGAAPEGDAKAEKSESASKQGEGASEEAQGPGAKKVSQGSGQISIYDVSIEKTTSSPR